MRGSGQSHRPRARTPWRYAVGQSGEFAPEAARCAQSREAAHSAPGHESALRRTGRRPSSHAEIARRGRGIACLAPAVCVASRARHAMGASPAKSKRPPSVPGGPNPEGFFGRLNHLAIPGRDKAAPFHACRSAPCLFRIEARLCAGRLDAGPRRALVTVGTGWREKPIHSIHVQSYFGKQSLQDMF
jgi:hypothetical protein